jgi:hypothetical protein
METMMITTCSPTASSLARIFNAAASPVKMRKKVIQITDDVRASHMICLRAIRTPAEVTKPGSVGLWLCQATPRKEEKPCLIKSLFPSQPPLSASRALLPMP